MRLQGYDYAEEGAYFVTAVMQGREALFGRVVNGEMVLNAYGRIVEKTWKDLVNHNAGIALEEFVVMPNHFHGILIIDAHVGAGSRDLCAPERDGLFEREGKPALFNEGHGPIREGHGPSPTGRRRSLSEIMRQFKTFSAKWINALRQTPGQPVWQRSFYDHIIRGERDYYSIAEYIDQNPLNWEKDQEILI